MTDVFISYSRKDKAFVQRLHAALLNHKRNTWVDWQDILPTEKWWQAIEFGIEGAETFVFIISPDSSASEVCDREVKHAIQHNKRLVPILHRETAPDQIHPALSAHNWLFMREGDDFELAFDRLLKAIDIDLGYVRNHTRLIERAVEWDRGGRDNSFLLRGKDLTASEQWLKQGKLKQPAPTALQIEYITTSRTVQHRKLKPRNVLLISAAAAALVIAVRFLELLQPLELRAYDHLIRIRPSEPQDDRFLVVAIDEASSQLLDRDYGVDRATLPDPAFVELLDKLQSYQPRVIALDLYRPAASPGELAARLEQTENLVAICKSSETGWEGDRIADGTSPPPEVSPERVGFGDFLDDGGKLVRRQILDQAADPDFCNTETAFSLVIAQRYLEAEGVSAEAIATSEGDYQQQWRWGNGSFQRIGYGSMYQYQFASYQVLLNYRAHQGDPASFAPRVSLADILTGQLSEQDIQKIRDRIVLIGTTDVTTRDVDAWSTPYGGRQMPGVIIQGQMTSQIVSAVLDGRSTISWWPVWANLLWTVGWAAVGGFVVWSVQRPLHLGLAGVGAIASLYIVCSGLFVAHAVWVPLIPSALALVLAGAGVGYITYRLRKA